MKQMRSRFRLITLLLVCAFLLVLAVCSGTALKAAGITLDSLASSLPVIGATPAPDPSASPGESPDPGFTPGSSILPALESGVPDTDNTPDPEYNVFGL